MPYILRTIFVTTAAPLTLAGVGLVHPHHLTPSTADQWASLHILLLPVFPLLPAGLLVPLWGRPGRDVAGCATVLAWVAAFVYAAFYTGLDAVAGIAAGTAGQHVGEGTRLGPVVRHLFATGGMLGHVGAYALGVAALAASAALFLRYGARTLLAAPVLVVSCSFFLDSHIFWPRGVFAMLGFALAYALLTWAVSTSARARRPS